MTGTGTALWVDLPADHFGHPRHRAIIETAADTDGQPAIVLRPYEFARRRPTVTLGDGWARLPDDAGPPRMLTRTEWARLIGPDRRKLDRMRDATCGNAAASSVPDSPEVPMNEPAPPATGSPDCAHTDTTRKVGGSVVCTACSRVVGNWRDDLTPVFLAAEQPDGTLRVTGPAPDH